MEAVDLVFENTRFETDTLDRFYADCTFVGCHFSSVLFSGVTFENCRFDTCDLSLAGFKGAVLHNVRFVGCKTTGADFTTCSPFSTFGFAQCQMDYVNFREMKLAKTQFDRCDLTEVDFGGANLQGCRFADCNLSRALFDGADLSQADLSSAHHVMINPQHTKLKNARFSRQNIEGLIAHLGIKLVD